MAPVTSLPAALFRRSSKKKKIIIENHAYDLSGEHDSEQVNLNITHKRFEIVIYL